MHGFLNIDKPAGLTSFDVVARVRRATGIRRVGHAGTLDPAATGVLPVAVGGAATRLIDMLVDAPKAYRAEVHFGIETDTYDADGTVTATTDAAHLDAAHVAAALRSFVGTFEQQPPAYSAIKRQGVPAYRAARRGEVVELPARSVTVHALTLQGWHPAADGPRASVDVECAKGFYVRSLAFDLGRALGTGAHLAALRRTRVGPFHIEDAVPLDVATEALAHGAATGILLPLDVVLQHLPPVVLTEAQAQRVAHGLAVTIEPGIEPGAHATVRAYGPDGTLLALLRPTGRAREWHPDRVFPTDSRESEV